MSEKLLKCEACNSDQFHAIEFDGYYQLSCIFCGVHKIIPKTMPNDVIDAINEKIDMINADPRYPLSPSDDANVYANAPLALIQMGLKGSMNAYKTCIMILKS